MVRGLRPAGGAGRGAGRGSGNTKRKASAPSASSAAKRSTSGTHCLACGALSSSGAPWASTAPHPRTGEPTPSGHQCAKCSQDFQRFGDKAYKSFEEWAEHKDTDEGKAETEQLHKSAGALSDRPFTPADVAAEGHIGIRISRHFTILSEKEFVSAMGNRRTPRCRAHRS